MVASVLLEARNYPGSEMSLTTPSRAAGLRLAAQIRGALAVTKPRSTDITRALRPESYSIRTGRVGGSLLLLAQTRCRQRQAKAERCPLTFRRFKFH